MKNIKLADTTLCRENSTYSFKEKIEIARQLERLNVDSIELPEIENIKTDILLVKTISSFVKNSVLSVCAGKNAQGIENAAAALQNAAHPRLRVELPVSTVGMEYICHKKAPKMASFVSELVSLAKEKCIDVEFCATDAARADKDFLISMILTAVSAGATAVTVCDNAAEMMPDDFAGFIKEISEKITDKNIDIAVFCSDKNGLAAAGAVLAVKNGASCVKTAVGGNAVQLETFGGIIKNCGETCGFSSGIKYTELNRIIKQIKWITGGKNERRTAVINDTYDSVFGLDANDDRQAVISAALKLGYDLSDEDETKVYEEFRRVAAKKKVGAKELEAIVASCAMQVPPTYTLVSYVINNGNIISSSAQITLKKDGIEHQGICIGDGPIDAAFLAVEQITGQHYELDDFQIQSVTEGKEAVGTALVKLKSGGKLYSGNGVSTDIIDASIRAYIAAVNKIVYEEA